jgi:hypothetical protein
LCRGPKTPKMVCGLGEVHLTDYVSASPSKAKMSSCCPKNGLLSHRDTRPVTFSDFLIQAAFTSPSAGQLSLKNGKRDGKQRLFAWPRRKISSRKCALWTKNGPVYSEQSVVRLPPDVALIIKGDNKPLSPFLTDLPVSTDY